MERTHEYHTGTRDALGQQLTKELDREGLPEKVINEAGQEKSFVYDRRGNALLIRDYDGSTLEVSYHDILNLPVAVMDDLGNKTQFEYDDKGNLITQIAADGAQTHYEYNERGWPVVITDPRGGKNQLNYDKTGNLIQRTDCSGQSTQYRYDRHSNLTAITDALKQTTTYRYDVEHRLTHINYPDGSGEAFTYNALGQLTRYTNPEGKHTDYTLDKEGRPTKRRNSLGGELGYEYDAHGRLTHLINENGAEYKFAYDPLDRLIHEQGVDDLITGYHYDPVGNVTQKLEDERGKEQRKTRFVRDQAGRLQEKYIAKGALHSRTRYQYDELGQLTQARNEDSRVDLRYDPLGRLHSEVTTSQAGTHAVSHTYDAFGNRLSTTLPSGQTLNWLYYGSGHLHQINLDGQVISDYERDPLHREIDRTQGKLHSATQYDPLGRILKQQTRFIPDLDDSAPNPQGSQQPNQWRPQNNITDPVRLQRSYRYTPAGELAEIQDKRNGLTHYGYDALGRITAATHQQSRLQETFAFDPAHNLIPANEAGSTNDNNARPNPDTNTPSTTRSGYIKNNRLEVFEDKRYQYDTFGNLTEKKVGKHTQMHFSYDAEHQMTEAVVTKNETTQRYQYAYDPFGRRISKTDAFNRTDFVWDGNRLLSEARGSRSKTYVYEQDGFVPVAQVITDQGSEGTENENTPTTKAANDLLYYHTDHLGTPRELSDQEGHIVWAASYKAWGNTLQIDYPDLQQKAEMQAYPLPQEDIDRLDIKQLREKRADKAHALIEQWEDDYSQNLRFQGQYFDRETGLHYNRFRYYDPDVGRFVTQDPIGLLGGGNFYLYAPNSTAWIDPLGLANKGVAIVRQYPNGYQEGHFTIQVKGNGISSNTHQVITKSDLSQTTITSSSGHDLANTPVHEAKIPLEDTESASQYQNSQKGKNSGEYDAIDNSCLSHCIDVINAGGGKSYKKSNIGYYKFFKDNGFGRLDVDKKIVD